MHESLVKRFHEMEILPQWWVNIYYLSMTIDMVRILHACASSFRVSLRNISLLCLIMGVYIVGEGIITRTPTQPPQRADNLGGGGEKRKSGVYSARIKWTYTRRFLVTCPRLQKWQKEESGARGEKVMSAKFTYSRDAFLSCLSLL